MIELPIIGDDDDEQLFHVRYEPDRKRTNTITGGTVTPDLGPNPYSKPRALTQSEYSAYLGGGQMVFIDESAPPPLPPDDHEGPRPPVPSPHGVRLPSVYARPPPSPAQKSPPSPAAAQQNRDQRGMSEPQVSAELGGGQRVHIPEDDDESKEPLETTPATYRPRIVKTPGGNLSGGVGLNLPEGPKQLGRPGSLNIPGRPRPESLQLPERPGSLQQVPPDSPPYGSTSPEHLRLMGGDVELADPGPSKLDRKDNHIKFIKQLDPQSSEAGRNVRNPNNPGGGSALALALNILDKKTREDEFTETHLLPIWRPKNSTLGEASRILTFGTSQYLQLKPEILTYGDVEGITELGAALAKNASVTDMNLSSNYLGDATITSISPALMMNTTLTKLNLSHNSIPGHILPVLKLGLAKNSTLIDLDLSQNPVGDSNGKEIANLIQDSIFRRLNFAGVNLGPEGARNIAPAISRCCTDLNLNENGFEDEGVVLLVEALKQGNVRTLHLGSNKIGLNGLSVLLELFDIAPYRLLDLSGNVFGDEGVELLARTIGNRKVLQFLNLSNMPLGPLGAKGVAHLLETNTHLRSIDLSYTNLDAAGIETISSALKINSSTLCALKLDGVALNAAATESLSHVLRSTTALQQLSLQDCKLTTEASRFIAVGLAENNTLKELNISRNYWTNMKDILDKIETHKELQILFIYNVDGDLQQLLERLSRISGKKKIRIKHSGNKIARAKLLASNVKRRIDPFRSALVFFTEFIQFAAFPWSIKNLVCQTQAPPALASMIQFYHGIQFDWETSFAEKYWFIIFLVGLFLVPFLPITNGRILLHVLRKSVLFNAWDVLITLLSVVLFVPITRQMLTGISCTLFSGGPSKLDVNTNILCWVGDHQPMAGAAFLAIPLFLFFCLRLSRVEGSILRTDCLPFKYWDWSQDQIEVKDFLFSHCNPTRSLIAMSATFILVAFSVFLAPYPLVLLIAYLVVSLTMIVTTTLYPPYKEPWVSSFKVGLLSAVAWSNLLGLVTLYTCDTPALQLTLYVYLGGFFPVVAIGTLASLFPVRFRKQMLDLQAIKSGRIKNEEYRRRTSTYRSNRSVGSAEEATRHQLTSSRYYSRANSASSFQDKSSNGGGPHYIPGERLAQLGGSDKDLREIKEAKYNPMSDSPKSNSADSNGLDPPEIVVRPAAGPPEIVVASVDGVFTKALHNEFDWKLGGWIPEWPIVAKLLPWVMQGLIWVMMIWFGGLCIRTCFLESNSTNSSLVIVLGFLGAWVSGSTGALSLDLANKNLERGIRYAVLVSCVITPVALAVTGPLCLAGKVVGCALGAGTILSLLGWTPITIAFILGLWALYSYIRYRNVGSAAHAEWDWRPRLRVALSQNPPR